MTMKSPTPRPATARRRAERAPPLRMRPTALRGLACAALSILSLAGGTGCVQLAALWANMTGGDWIEPEYRLSKGPLLVFIDDSNHLIAEPQVAQELHKTISEIFLEMDVNRRVIPYEHQQRLARSEKDFARLSARQVGEKLGADEILWIHVSRFTTREEPGSDLFKGHFAVRVRVLSTEARREVRRWPSDRAGKQVVATTPTEPADGDRSGSDVARELAIKLGKSVAKLFYGYRSLEDR